MTRTFAALPLWLAMTPAFVMGWLPWWYAVLVWAGASVSEGLAENIGRLAGKPETRQ